MGPGQAHHVNLIMGEGAYMFLRGFPEHHHSPWQRAAQMGRTNSLDFRDCHHVGAWKVGAVDRMQFSSQGKAVPMKWRRLGRRWQEPDCPLRHGPQRATDVQGQTSEQCSLPYRGAERARQQTIQAFRPHMLRLYSVQPKQPQ